MSSNPKPAQRQLERREAIRHIPSGTLLAFPVRIRRVAWMVHGLAITRFTTYLVFILLLCLPVERRSPSPSAGPRARG
jgi:hypothetical protein